MSTNPQRDSIRQDNFGTENSVRHIDFIRDMENLKLEYQIRCSHYELEYNEKEKMIVCAICSKKWLFLENRGYSKIKSIFTADKSNES